MAKNIDWNRKTNRAQIWKKDTEGSSVVPLLPPPPPPPTNRVPANSSLQPSSFPSAIPSDWDEGNGQWPYSKFETRVADSHENLPDLNLRKRQGQISPATWYDTADIIYSAPIKPPKQVQVVAVMQENQEGDRDKLSKYVSLGRDDTQDLPPPPPRLDFPADTRMSKLEYRRSDERDDGPRLRAELYPLEEEQARKQVDRQRQTLEKTEILPERNPKEQTGSDLNLAPSQRKKEVARSQYYQKDDAGPSHRNISRVDSEFTNTKEYEKRQPYDSGMHNTRGTTYANTRGFSEDKDMKDRLLGAMNSTSDVNERRNVESNERRLSGSYNYMGLQAQKERKRNNSRDFDFDNQTGNLRSSVEEFNSRNDARMGRRSVDPRSDRQMNLEGSRERTMNTDWSNDRRYNDDFREYQRNSQDYRIDSQKDKINFQEYQRNSEKDTVNSQKDRIGSQAYQRNSREYERNSKDYRTNSQNDRINSQEYQRNSQDRRHSQKDRISSLEYRRNSYKDIIDSQEYQRNSREHQRISKEGRRNEDDTNYKRSGLSQNDIKTNADGAFDSWSGYVDQNISEEDSRRLLYKSSSSAPRNQTGITSGNSSPRNTSSTFQVRSARMGYKTPETLRKRTGEDSKTSTSKKASPVYEILQDDADEILVERRDSILLPALEESEREFHELVAAGDVVAVRNFLQDHPGFNINCVNYQKISALHVAVHEQNEAMVEFLLEQKALDCSDCALYAIKEGNVRIVEKIMDRIKETSPGLEYAATSHSVDFPDDMTPIILAAQLGNYEIIDFLIKREHRIPPVHNPYCKCEACKNDLQRYDRLKYSTMKLNLYKAICNPMYIFHVTDDPFQRAFDLTQELQDAAKVFPQFKSSYEELWKEMRNFTVELIGCCRNAQEVEIILKKSANNIAGSITFPRLQYAIDLKQKEFVSHPYTQAVLVDAWTGDLLEWKVQSPLMQALSVFPRIPMLPVMAVMCMFLPNHKLVKKWKTPVNKMISSVASYLIFLIILFLESNLDKRNQKRGPPDSGLEGLIIIYVIGYVWLNVRVCFRLGPKRFFSTMWHWFDCIMLFLFTMTIVFWIASLADVTANNEIDLPRKYWNSLDPELIAEGFFAAAVIMAFFRLNMFLSLNYHLGPLQVSIGKMTLDIFRFIIIFFIIILAWCAGLCRFYQPYDGMVQKDAASGSSTTQVSSFVSFSMTLKTFFWAIFGMSPIESADVVIENLPGDTPNTTIINHHKFTEAVGYIAFALFQFLSVVVVLNMLVACMANTFTKVIDNVTVEWVFGRSQIYLSFMAASTLPPPFNLLPTAAGIKSTLLWLKLLAKPNDGKRAKCNITHCCYIESETEPYVNTEFPALMSQLAQRYLRLKGESVETHDDLEELKCEVKDLLRKMDKIISLRKSWDQFK